MLNIEPTIRAATGDDSPCISVLAAQVFADTYTTPGTHDAVARHIAEELSASAMAASIADPDNRFIVAEVANRLVGFVQLRLRSENTAAGCRRGRAMVSDVETRRLLGGQATETQSSRLR